jgi:hypothetical protein
MHLTGSAYGRAWKCRQGQEAGSGCLGAILLNEEDSLTSLQIAEDIAGCGGAGSEGDAMGQGGYRSLSEALSGLGRSPYLSSAEKRLLAEAAAIVDRLAEAADLARDADRRKERLEEADREARYRQALGLLGPALAPDPIRLEASAVALLALDRYSGAGQFDDADPVEDADPVQRLQAAADQNPLDLLFRDLVSAHQRLREAIARDWSARPEPLEDLHAHLSSELPRLRAAILASPPAYLYGVRRLLADSETANVVWLPTHRSP